jgi:hypothetical protein
MGYWKRVSGCCMFVMKRRYNGYTIILKLLPMRIYTTGTKMQQAKLTGPQADFSRAGKCSKLIGDAFHKLLFNLSEPQSAARLFALVYNITRTDYLHAVGSRKITSGQIDFLEGFDFNKRKQLTKIFNGAFTVSINRHKGVCVLDVPAFDPVRDLRWKGRVTHFKILAAAAVLDFRGMKYLTSSEESEYLDVQGLTAASLQLNLPARTRRPIVVVMGIEFYQFVGRRYFLRQQDGAKSLTIVRVV